MVWPGLVPFHLVLQGCVSLARQEQGVQGWAWRILLPPSNTVHVVTCMLYHSRCTVSCVQSVYHGAIGFRLIARVRVAVV